MTEVSDVYSFELADGRLAYRDTGTGQPLVLLHGGFLDHGMWDDQVPAFASDYRVIAPDARGHGGSTNANGPFRQCDDLAALLRHLDVGPAILVGLSMGAGIAVDTALEHPDLVRALVVSGAGTNEPEFQDPWVKEMLAEQARALADADAERWIDAWMRGAAGPHRSLDDVAPHVVRRIRSMLTRTVAKHTSTEPVRLVPVPDTWKRAAQVTIPVLAINGSIDSDDHIEMAERLVHAVADGRTATIEGTAHYPNMERPAAFNEALADFLAALSAQNGPQSL
ncbi:alpha/beta fold hydrolase [Streptomyces sp. NPDC059008]|uniref:alpha/beta fold hydrolase n=1 Tax=Streptomyces sp. NPDC059008 TaxID=3346693 RepID=UPI003683C9BB